MLLQEKGKFDIILPRKDLDLSGFKGGDLPKEMRHVEVDDLLIDPEKITLCFMGEKHSVLLHELILKNNTENSLLLSLVIKSKENFLEKMHHKFDQDENAII